MNIESKAGIRKRISTVELERRWKAVREAMKDMGLDYLIFQNSVAHLGGYIKWFTDMPVAHGYPATVIFPRDDEMTTIWHGPRPPEEPSPPASAMRGVKKRISVPTLPSLAYSSIFDAEEAVSELAPYKNCHIGLVGMGFINAAFYRYVTEHLDTAKFEDATDMVDNIKAIKSDEEINHIRETCEIQDTVLEYTLTRVQPGKSDNEIRTEIIHKCLDMGVTEYNIMAGSMPPKVLKDGDTFNILLETDGPSGFWGEISRTICLSKVPPQLEEHFELARQAQKVSLELLKPGIDPMTIWDANNEFMRRIGSPEERRFHAHGMGYDMVERPSINPGETMKIQARMHMAVHPAVKSDKMRAGICDNYIVSETGEPEALHETPQKIFVV